MIGFIIGLVLGIAAAIAFNAKWPLPFAKVTEKAEDVLGI